MKKIIHYAHLMRLHKPIGTFLLLWPTLWALWIAADGTPDLKIVIIFMAGVLIMRSAGDVINDLADRHFDGHVNRTKDRPLVTGSVTVKEAVVIFSVLCVIALCLVLQLNLFTIVLSVIGLILAIVYPFTKRITYWPQLILGFAYAWGVPMAFSAQTNSLPLIAWILYATAILWTLAYDTFYAMVDRADDLRIGIKSTAILFGRNDRLIVGIIQLLVLLLLMGIGYWLRFKLIYFISLLLATALIIYQQYLVKDRDPQKCFQAFLNNNWVGLIIFLGIFFNYY